MNLKDHLEKLPYFYEVAKLGSMKKASEAIFITQPSLTKSIKSLEESIGKELFIRLPRGVALTKEGELLFEFCHELFHSVSNIERRLLHPLDPHAGEIRVGTYDSIAAYFWPGFLKVFLKKYPRINLELTTGRSEDIQKKLEQGELDAILIVAPRASKDLILKPIMQDSFFLYEASKFKEPEEGAPIIYMPSAFTGKLLQEDQGLAQLLSERKLYKTSSLETVKELALGGIGQGLLPSNVAAPLLAKKRFKKVKTKKLSSNGVAPHEIGFAYHRTGEHSSLIQLLESEIKQSLN
ncbi:MAG: hypothetical protein CME65_08660 [Halobacteriovoraceae bacterium]|nr:hypothetical protein [Halobacteriovoraceae bacterium]|tara:strand:+ start:8616 stop:9497 length:882 start_codon:yes stop_codon:yes gene_type:complete